jgi:Big-like domain-containing protein
MKFSWRAVLCAVVMVGATGAFKACNSDGPTSGGEDPPVTVDDRIEATATGVSALAVLTNDTKLDNPPLTYTIEDSPSVGSASFNSDNTVALTLPSGFKGLTKFRYKVTNSKGGFSISSVTVFVDVPSYRALFAAKTGTTGTYELYVSDFISSTKISSAVNGNQRLQSMWKAKNGSLVVYERADPANVSSTAELFFVKPTSNPSPVKIPLALNRAVIDGATVAIDDGGRYIAYATNPSSGSGGTPTNLYVLDSQNPNSPLPVTASAGLATGFTQWIGNGPTLYYVAPQGSGGHAVLRADGPSFDAPQRISPVYQSTDQETAVLISPEGTGVLVVGTHGGQNGAFFIDPTNPGIERRLTTDMPAGTTIEAFRTDENVTRLVYLWRLANSTTARLSVVDISANATPQTAVQGTNLLSLSDLRPDLAAALITRGTGAAGSDGALNEVTLDGSGDSVLIAPNVTGGVYADADRVYLYSRTLTPSVLQRANFERTPDALVRSSTPAGALFVSPIFQPTAAILEDPTSGVVLVNAAAPGKTLKFTDMQIGSVANSTLLPTLIGPAQ